MTKKESLAAEIAAIEAELSRTPMGQKLAELKSELADCPDDAPAETKTDFSGFISHLQSKGMLQPHELETGEEAMRRAIMNTL